MKQKIDDLKLILKTDRKIWAGAGFLVVALLIWMLKSDETIQQPTSMEREPLPVATVASTVATDSYGDLIAAFRSNVDQVQQENKTNKASIDRLTNDFREYREQSKGLFENFVDKIEQLNTEVGNLSTQLQQRQTENAAAPGQPGSNEPAQQENALEAIGFEVPTVPPPPVKLEPIRASVISPGDSAKAILLTGVNAPVDGTPYPVVLKIVGPITGPDGSSVDIGEARLIAAATGSETDGRALFRLTSLAMRAKDGRRIVLKVDGWVVGEDGIRGMKGKLIDKLGKLIAAAGTVGFTAAMGESLTNNNQLENNNDSGGLTIVSGDLNYATANALSDASSKLNQVLMDRYEKLVPVVEILSGRDAAIVFSQPVEIQLIDEDEADEGLYHTAALD